MSREKPMKKGMFIVIEGGVGSGKSTLFNKLKRRFKSWKFYREPGSTPFGERIRKAVQGCYNYPVDKYAAFFAYSSARANLVRGKIQIDLKNGDNVVLDRYWFSTYAYQGTEGVDKKDIISVSKNATNGLMPDLIIHLDQDPKIGILRKLGRRDADRYDLKELKFHREIRKNYLELAKLFKNKWKIIDATQSKENVFKDALEILNKFHIVL